MNYLKTSIQLRRLIGLSLALYGFLGGISMIGFQEQPALALLVGLLAALGGVHCFAEFFVRLVMKPA